MYFDLIRGVINPISSFNCISVRTCVHRVRGCSGLWCDCVCQRKCAFLRGSRSLLCWLCVCNLVFDYLVDTQRFMGIGCSSWYKREPV